MSPTFSLNKFTFDPTTSAMSSTTIPPRTPAPGPPTPSAATPTTVVIPIFGGVTNGVHPWTGGKPLTNYSKTTLSEPYSPWCYHLADPDKAMKIHKFRTSGIELDDKTKFSRASTTYPLLTFSRDAHQHMRETGMDSEFYFIDPSDSVIKNIFDNHARFTIESVDKQLQDGLGQTPSRYDSYSLKNLQNSAKWLMNSLDSDLRGTIRNEVTDDVTGPHLWMVIVSHVETDSYRRYQSMEHNLKSLSIKSYPGENIVQFCDAYLGHAVPMEIAGYYKPELLLSLVEEFGTSSVERFRIPFLTYREEVETFVLLCFGKDAHGVLLLTKQHQVSFRLILARARKSYLSLKEGNLWGPAITSKTDSGAAPSGYVTRAEAHNVANKLVQKALHRQGPGGGAETRTCRICNKKGHIAKDCPDRGKNDGGNGKGKKGDGARHTPKAAWKAVPPKAGEPETKQQDDKTWKWCGKCGFWRLGHGTKEHEPSTDPIVKPSGGSAHVASAGTDPAPPPTPTAAYCGLVSNHPMFEDDSDASL